MTMLTQRRFSDLLRDRSSRRLDSKGRTFRLAMAMNRIHQRAETRKLREFRNKCQKTFDRIGRLKALGY